MISTEEENFPRGGHRPKIKTLKRPKEDDNLFQVSSAPKQKKAKKTKSSLEKPINEDTFYAHLNIQGTLTYNKIQTDMVILGCVRHITDFSIEVELPGITFGHVNITRISDSFTKLLNNKLATNEDESDVVLKKMFHIGQFIPVKVLEVEEKEKGVHVECTINPRDIFKERFHNWFEKGMLIWGSIQSVLDHGYEVNVGVKNCRVFLPSKNVDDGRHFMIGEPFWCTIHKCDSTNNATTLRVSSKMEHVNGTKTEAVNNLDDLIPGMQIEFIIDKVTSKGIQGKFLNDYFGYIDHTQLKDPLDTLTNYEEGKLITAYVLFTELATKVTYLTLRNLDPVPPPSLNIGEIVKAQIVLKGSNGVYLSCPKGEKSFIANKRLIASLPKKSEIDIQGAVTSKFSIGSKHLIRILDYNHMSRLYISTVELQIIKETNFSSNDLISGQLLNVTIENVKTEGLVVSSGRIKGFVPNLYISNVEFSDNLKKKYKEGMKANARVLYVDDGNVIFTLKPTQVESDQCLISLDQAKRGEKYPGVVVQTKEAGALVVFYNNVKGWISKKRIGDDAVTNVDPTKYFYKGQVVNFWILGVKNGKAYLSIRAPFEFKPPESLKLHIGQRIGGIVSAIHKDSIDIKNKRGLIVGKIPCNHISTYMSLCSTLLKTFKVGDVIDELICIDNTTIPCLLSRKEAISITRTSKIKIKKLENLKKGNLIKCFFVSKTKTGILVKPLLVDYSETILIDSRNIVEKGESVPTFKPQQSMVAKILSINYERKEIQLTTKLSEVFDSNIEGTFERFSYYMKDLLHIRKIGAENNLELCRFQPGERINCKVERLGDEGGCLVILPNGVQGLVPPRLCPDDIQVGQCLTGVFLAENFDQNFVEICLKKDVIQKINVLQDGVIKSSNIHSLLAEKILIKNDYIMAVLKPENCNRQFIYIPTHLHENDFSGCKSFYELSKIKLCICGEVEHFLVGMSKKLFSHLEKQNKKVTKNKHDKKVTKEVKQIESTQLSIKEVTNHTQENSVKQSKNKKDNREQNIERSKGSVIGDLETSQPLEEDENRGSDDSSYNSDEGGEKISKSIVEENKSRKRKKIVLSEDRDKGNITSSEDAMDSSNIDHTIKLSGVASFFNPVDKETSESSSDDEENDVVVKKKKKLSPKERAEQIRLEEERIAKIEKEIADNSGTPESAENFDRLLLANPNSSELWTKYMSFHLAATEIDKARTVAKRALEAIDMALIEERLNIWVALLNLENMLGTSESFEKTFDDALRYNDSLEIYLKVIQMLAESGKFTEMEEKIKKVRNKHKQEPKMWLEVAKTYYLLKRFQEARNLKEACLKSIQNKKSQMELIIRFAIMEFKYGEEEQGSAIFETVLSNDPKKVTAWTVYVDQLVKLGQIEQARRVLERAVSMHLPIKSMKSLYLKFRMFEEEHGTPESVEAVKGSAKMYFERVSKKLD